jgi:hypothetical protein
MLALHGLGRGPIQPLFLFIDTDRAESDKLACRFYWPHAGRLRALKLTPPGTKHHETTT